MKVSVIIPVYNEEKTIATLLRQVLDVDLKDIEKEIIIVDDSNDGTKKIITDNFAKNSKVKLILRDKPLGKGNAIREGIKHATGEIILIQDADLEYDPQDYPALIAPIINGECKVVYGSRFLSKINKHKYGLNFFATKLLSWMTNILYFADITDEPTCYKVFDKDVLKSINLKCEGFEFCPEVTAKTLKKGYAIKEIPIAYMARAVEDGKKVTWKDGAQAVWLLLKYRFVD